jgi:hypothetical protein
MILYDKLPWNRRLALDLQMREYNGVTTFDHARPHHALAFHGTPTWTQNVNDLNYLDFEAATPDWLDCAGAATADLDFVAGAFTFATWLSYESVGFRYLFARGLTDTDGWEWAINNDSALWLRTNQAGAGAHQDTTSVIGSIPLATWTFVVTTRNGAAVNHYVNGVLSVGTAGVHVNPLTSARELHIGIADGEAAGFFDGTLWRPRIWGTVLGSRQIAELYTIERRMLGV